MGKWENETVVWNYITIIITCAIFESVCNRQSSKALELAAAYLQVKKGTKEANNTIKTKLIHKPRNGNGMEILH